jgi:hypothetical protein
MGKARGMAISTFTQFSFTPHKFVLLGCLWTSFNVCQVPSLTMIQTKAITCILWDSLFLSMSMIVPSFQTLRMNCSQVLVAHTCNPSYSGGRNQEDQSQPKANSSWAPISKTSIQNRAGGVAKVVECLASKYGKYEILSSSQVLPLKKKNELYSTNAKAACQCVSMCCQNQECSIT